MPSAAEVAWLIPLLPLVGATLVGLGLISFNRTLNRLRTPVAALLISCVGGSAALSYGVLLEQLNGAAPYEQLFTWASAGTFNLQMGFCVDPLGAVMLALVTTIALLVMVYSHGYMA
ncbi:MAG: NAD(P)H-quinone oxidoreductase subunit F, partial [Prochlorococcaceae cyanobacterium]